MNKSIGSAFLAFLLLPVLLSACGSPAATQPTATTVPCPTIAPLSTAAEKLSLFQAITREKVSFHLTDYVVPRNASDTLLIVFFEGFDDSGVSVSDMDWILRDEECNELKSIGFGIPISEEPVMMVGTLMNGSVYPISDGADPLFALIFVMSKETTEVTLLGPQRQEHTLLVSKEWLPNPENVLINLESDGRIEWDAEGENWGME